MQFINNFRGIAILLVVFMHSIYTISKGDSFSLLLLHHLLFNSTVLFVVVAGYLFSFQIKTFNYKNFLMSKVSTVVIPYIVISIPIVSLYILGLKSTHIWIDMDWFVEQNPVFQYIYLMLTGSHLGPLWFVPMVIVFYFLSPFIVLLKNNNMLIIAFFICLIPAIYLGRPEHNENSLLASVYFFPPYLLGLIASQKKNLYEKFKNISVFILGLYVLFYLIIFNYFEMSSSIDLCLKMILAIIVLSVCSNFLTKKNKILDMFARLSFFIFLVHGYFTGAIRTVNNHFGYTYTGFEFIYAVCTFGVVVLGSLAAFVLIKWMFNKKSKKWVGV
jgi:surface polysaccharide O-acyltransferase-like enzyme